MNSGNSGKLNAVFYADAYHPIQAGSIDGTDILPHDNAIYRAHLCSSAGLCTLSLSLSLKFYLFIWVTISLFVVILGAIPDDPFGDPKVIGDPYCTLFVGHLSHATTEDILHQAMSRYGRVKNLRLVRDIVTGASRGYAFVEFETEREMRRAYEDAHHSFIDDSEIIVDYNRQQLMPGWIPRRLGGGLGGKKESGQLRFGGRERPFRAPLRPIPYDDLKRLGIPPPPEGRYMSRFQVPSPPRRKRDSEERETSPHESKRKRNSEERDRSPHRSRRKRNSEERKMSSPRARRDRSPQERETRRDKHSYSHRHHKHRQHSHQHERRSRSRDRLSDSG